MYAAHDLFTGYVTPCRRRGDASQGRPRMRVELQDRLKFLGLVGALLAFVAASVGVGWAAYR